tara:strand:+ start:195 stop:626 length:432 start_codon:yes stop_codon:yes gene_type:complete
MGLDASRGANAYNYGHADYYYQRNQGNSAQDILGFLASGMDRLKGDNIPGGGGLYDEIFAAAQREKEIAALKPPPYTPPQITIEAPPPAPAAAPAPMAIRGNATGVKKKKTATEKTGRSASGSSQLNRSMFINPVAPLTNINV